MAGKADSGAGSTGRRAPSGWLRAWIAPLLLVAVAVVGAGITRAAGVELKYAALNPIRDAAQWHMLSGAPMDSEAVRPLLAGGSALAAETLYLPPHIVLRALSLGRQSALADVFFVRAHSYFLTHFFADRRFAWLDAYVDAVVALDPDNPRVYLWAAQVVKLGQDVNDAVVLHSNAFLEAGLVRFPRDWRMHMELGFNWRFEYRGANDADHAASQLKARDHFATAAGLPGAEIDPNVVAGLFDGDNENHLAVAYALQKYYEASPEQRDQLLRRVGALSHEIADGVRDEEVRWKRELPFAPVTLFSLVGDIELKGLSPTVLRAVAEAKPND